MHAATQLKLSLFALVGELVLFLDTIAFLVLLVANTVIHYCFDLTFGNSCQDIVLAILEQCVT
jgi:hypothetical protein